MKTIFNTEAPAKRFVSPAKIIGLLPVLLILLLVTSKAEAAFSTVDCTDLTHTAMLGIPQVECEDLESLWTDTNGGGWTNSNRWDTLTAAGTWAGVTVFGGRVTKITLAVNNLVGTIPSFSALTSLQDLRLQGNQLSGSIPDFSTLTNLLFLFLNSNQLNGVIPSFSTLTNLQFLGLNRNQLSGVIPGFSTLTNLQFLDLNRNQLSGVIPDFSALTNLQTLELYKNQLTGAIPDLTSLPSLASLRFQENGFVFSDFEAEHVSYTGLSNYEYTSQALVDTDRTQTVAIGATLVITPQVAANPSGNDSYQWYKNGFAIAAPAGTQRVYSITASASDAGDYTYRVTNAVVTGLTLYSHYVPDAILVVIQGNCNGDSVVDILDVACAINIAKSTGTPNGNGADTEPDGDVDAVDVTTTIGTVLAP